MTIKNNLISEYKDRISKLREDHNKLGELKNSEKSKIDELHAISQEMEDEMSDLLESFDKTKEEIIDDIENPEEDSDIESDEDRDELEDVNSSTDDSEGDIEEIEEDLEDPEESNIHEDLDIADEQPEGAIFIIPIKLKECSVPDRLRQYQWVNLFTGGGPSKLEAALQLRGASVSQSRGGPTPG